MQIVKFSKHADGRPFVVIDTSHPCMECDTALDIRVELGQGEVEVLLEEGQIDYTIDRACDEESCDGFNHYTLLEKSNLSQSEVNILEKWVETDLIPEKNIFSLEELGVIGEKLKNQFPEVDLSMWEDEKGYEMYFYLKSQGFDGDNFSVYPNGMIDKELEEEWESFGYVSTESLEKDLVKACAILVDSNRTKGKGR